MNFALIFTLAVGIYAVLAALIAMLAAAKRSWLMAILRLCATVVAAIAAVPVTSLVAGICADFAYDLILPMLGEQIEDFLVSVPVGAEGLRVIATLLVAPLLYILVFIVIRLVLRIVLWIIERVIPPLHKPKWRFISMPVGALTGALFALITVIPLCGFLMLGADLLHTVNDAELAEVPFVRENILDGGKITPEKIEGIADGLEEHPVIQAVYTTVGEPVFEALTTGTLDVSDTHGEVVTLNLTTELCTLVRTAGHAAEVMESFDRDVYTEADKQSLYKTADSFLSSDWVSMLATDSLVAMSESWLKNDTFAGLKRPSLNAAMNPTLNHVLVILSTETEATLSEDIHTIMDVVGDLKMHDLLTDNTDYTELVQKLGTSGLLTDMLAKLDENERLRSLSDEIKSLSIRLVTNMLGTDVLENGEYAEMMDSVADSLTDALAMSEAERDALIKNSVKDSFGDQGFDVPDEVVVELSHQIMEDLGADGSIDKDELTEYLLEHAAEGFDIAEDMIPDELPVDIPAM